MIDAVRKGDKQQVNLCLREYKLQNGSPNFIALFDVPNASRIRDLAKVNYEDTSDLVVAALTLAMENMNLKRGLSAGQINDLAEEIIDTSNDDNLAMEDLILFLQALTRGKYGELYESMDIIKFMGLFEKYRDERWQEWVRFKESEHTQFKTMGDPGRDKLKGTALDEHLAAYTQKLQVKNDEIKELRAERKRNQ